MLTGGLDGPYIIVTSFGEAGAARPRPRPSEAAGDSVDSLVLQTTIGLIVVFAAFGVAVSALTELVSRYIGLRGEYLLRGLQTLVDGPSHFTLPFSQLLRGPAGPPKGANNSSAPPARVAQLISHPLVAPSALAADPASRAGDRSLSNAERRNLPAYISGQTFAEALLDILDPDPTRPEEGLLSRLRTWARDQASSDALAKALLPLLSTAKDDVQLLETKISRWYDDHMARVSGWYKRHVRWISLCIGLVLVLAFNLNAVRIAQTLYSDQALRASVVTERPRPPPAAQRIPRRASATCAQRWASCVRWTCQWAGAMSPSAQTTLARYPTGTDSGISTGTASTTSWRSCLSSSGGR